MEQTVYSQTRLSARGAMFYFRAMLPNDLQRQYGKREVIFSPHQRPSRSRSASFDGAPCVLTTSSRRFSVRSMMTR